MSGHNEAHKLAARLMAARPVFCRLPAETRALLIADVTDLLADVDKIALGESYFQRLDREPYGIADRVEIRGV
jgi:hypothetical protein